MTGHLKVLAYARRGAAPSIAEQIQTVETWTTRARATVMKFQTLKLDPRASEFPPLEQVLGAVRRGEVNAIGVIDMARLGGSPKKIMGTLAAMVGRAHVVVVGDPVRILDPSSDVMTSALEIATALHQSWLAERRRDRPRRVCPPRVPVDLGAVRELQEQGCTLEEISQVLGVSRPTISRRLKRARHDQIGP